MAGKAVIFAFLIVSSIAMMAVQSQDDQYEIQPVGQGQYAGPGYEYLSQRQPEEDVETRDFYASLSQAESDQVRDARFLKFWENMNPFLKGVIKFLGKKAGALLLGR